MRNKILVVGQTPPPFGGQAIMIERLLEGKYKDTELFHVRMSFSREMNEMGRFSFFKIFHLILCIPRTKFIIKIKEQLY